MSHWIDRCIICNLFIYMTLPGYFRQMTNGFSLARGNPTVLTLPLGMVYVLHIGVELVGVTKMDILQKVLYDTPFHVKG